MELFRSRYITIVEDSASIEIRHKPKWVQVVFLFVGLALYSIFLLLTDGGFGVIIQLFFIFGFIIFLLLGIVRTFTKYPIRFTKSFVVIKSISDLSLRHMQVNYSLIDEVLLKQETENRWKFAITAKKEVIQEVYLYTDRLEQKKQLFEFDRALKKMGCPLVMQPLSPSYRTNN